MILFFEIVSRRGSEPRTGAIYPLPNREAPNRGTYSECVCVYVCLCVCVFPCLSVFMLVALVCLCWRVDWRCRGMSWICLPNREQSSEQGPCSLPSREGFEQGPEYKEDTEEGKGKERNGGRQG